MKQGIKTILLATALTFTLGTAMAQDNQGKGKGNRPSPEQMMEKRGNNIAKQLGLDEKTTKKFLSVYKSEQSDMRELMPKRGGMPPRGERPQGNPPQGNPPAMDGNQPKGRPQMSEEDKKKMDSLRQKYNKKYAKFLSQEQIAKVYELQKQELGKKKRKNSKGENK